MNRIGRRALIAMAVLLVVASTLAILGIKVGRQMYALFVTWFFYGQPPVNYQSEFPSAELCQAAKHDLLYEEIRLRKEAEENHNQEMKRGIERGMVPAPTVSVVCAKK